MGFLVSITWCKKLWSILRVFSVLSISKTSNAFYELSGSLHNIQLLRLIHNRPVPKLLIFLFSADFIAWGKELVNVKTDKTVIRKTESVGCWLCEVHFQARTHVDVPTLRRRRVLDAIPQSSRWSPPEVERARWVASGDGWWRWGNTYSIVSRERVGGRIA